MNPHLTLGFAFVGLLVSSTANAAPFTSEKVSLSGHLAYGAYLDDDDTDVSPYGFGMGARGGYTLKPGVYIGGLFEFFFGESDDTSVGIGPISAGGEASASSWLLQVEAGYDFEVTPTIVIRPKGGLGLTNVSTEVCAQALGAGACTDDSDSEFSFGLGAEALFDVGPVYIAPEMRFNLGSDLNALIFSVGVGGAL